ncbi:MAG TPA: hypothetical protein VFF03_04305 [Rhodocyclaceae bacterium]|nr:hypothetical protein [Rhodocyclaceae bacterium]
MKKFLTLLTAVAFASTALLAEAASPRAAEDAYAPVATTNAPVPKVRKAVHPRAKSVKARKHHGKKHMKLAKAKHKKRARLAHR